MTMITSVLSQLPIRDKSTRRMKKEREIFSNGNQKTSCCRDPLDSGDGGVEMEEQLVEVCHRKQPTTYIMCL